MVLRRVRVINAASLGNQGVQLAEHEAGRYQFERVDAKDLTYSSNLNFSRAESMCTRTSF